MGKRLVDSEPSAGLFDEADDEIRERIIRWTCPTAAQGERLELLLKCFRLVLEAREVPARLHSEEHHAEGEEVDSFLVGQSPLGGIPRIIFLRQVARSAASISALVGEAEVDDDGPVPLGHKLLIHVN